MAEKEVLKLRKLPSQERSRKTMTTIYETAARIFAEVGFAETTTDQIAAEAGISIGTLYSYFSAKEAILHGLWEQHQQEIMRVAQKVDKNIREQGYVDKSIIPMLLRIVLDLVSADKIQNRLFISQGGLPESIIQKRRELGMYLESVMENVFHDFANVRIKNAKVGVHIIWATVQAVIHDYIFSTAAEIQQEELIDELADMMSRYIFDDGQEKNVLRKREKNKVVKNLKKVKKLPAIGRA